MDSVSVPSILTTEEYRSLSPQIRERYVYGAVREIVKMNPNGVSLAEIVVRVPFDRKTISKHLERLVALNEAYTKSFGNTVVYYPNGRAIHPGAEDVYQIGKKTFRFILLDNPLGQTFYAQEVVRDSVGEEVKGGLLIPISNLDDFALAIKDFQTKVKARGHLMES